MVNTIAVRKKNNNLEKILSLLMYKNHTIKELKFDLSVTDTTMRNYLRELNKQELIKFLIHPNDQRQKEIKITFKGANYITDYYNNLMD